MSVVLDDSWEKILDNVSIDDPYITVDWNHDNVEATVATLQNHANGTAVLANPPPAWLTAPYSASTLQTQILRHLVDAAKQVWHDNGNGRNDVVGGVVGQLMIGPNTFQGYSSLMTNVTLLALDNFLANHASKPLGELYCGADRKAITISVKTPVDPLHGVANVLV